MRIVRAEGFAALFSGVSATVLRQTLYSTTRMGLYDVLKQKYLMLSREGLDALKAKVQEKVSRRPARSAPAAAPAGQES